MHEYSYFWWDGGFRAVHNEPRPELNADGRAHVLTPHYRLDLSRDCAMPVGFAPAAPESVQRECFGMVATESAHGVQWSLRAELAGQPYHVDHQRSETRALMVYDSGALAQHLRLKGVELLDDNGHAHPDVEVEIVFVCWQEMVAVSVLLLEKGNRLPAALPAVLSVELTGHLAPEHRICAHDNTIAAGNFRWQADGSSMCLHWHMGPVPKPARLTAVRTTESGQELVLPTTWSSLYAAFLVELQDYDGETPWRLRVQGATDSPTAVPCRIILMREGKPRLATDGTVNDQGVRDWQTGYVYPVAFGTNGAPNGATWQVSTDNHEFANFPQPYSRYWIRLYRQASIAADMPLCEEVRLAWPNSWARPAAQFRQLSLLGWDDNPQYGGNKNFRAVQLWIQGVIRAAEITCLSPESYMCDNVITDIRPIDQAHPWGPNLGGGDLLRYRLQGSQKRGRVVAARCDFRNYGPYLGTVRLHSTAENEFLTGVIDASIVAANDISRTFFDCRYEVVQDVELDELQLAFLGCPGYDFTSLSRYAWGQGKQCCGDELRGWTMEEGSRWLAEPVQPGSWYAAYRGGIVDEQKREPNGNRGMVIRAANCELAAAPDAQLSARLVTTKKFHVPTPQFHIHLLPEAAGQAVPLRLRRGDRIRIAWEYVPVLKYHTDYGRAAHCPLYAQILQDYPDSAEAVRYEAWHGTWQLRQVIGATPQADSLFPTLTAHAAEIRFELIGGAAFLPLRLVLPRLPHAVALEQECNGRWQNALVDDAEAPPYQLACEDGQWVVTALLQGAPAALDADLQTRHYRLAWQ